MQCLFQRPEAVLLNIIGNKYAFNYVMLSPVEAPHLRRNLRRLTPGCTAEIENRLSGFWIQKLHREHRCCFLNIRMPKLMEEIAAKSLLCVRSVMLSGVPPSCFVSPFDKLRASL